MEGDGDSNHSGCNLTDPAEPPTTLTDTCQRFRVRIVVGAEGLWFVFIVGVRVRGRCRGCSRCLVRVRRWRLCSSVRRCPFAFVVHMLGRGG
jgi:hypothetical protein